ncbi:intercellular adhesion molecule 1-like [Sparus aurata]|uniref:Intercellular adhesion molecule 1-like n=1 Tax=Sparus aurata TaxID=8175 RepID=A0A671TH04_SPAAU|nr:intercellular adhesion molecule 1-like [Sparus aurata]
MQICGRPITLLLVSLLGSATSSPVSICTPAQPPLSQILPPSPAPTVLQSLPSPSPGLASASGASAGKGGCRLTVSPSTLVVRFGDPFTANCSGQGMDYSGLGWVVSPLKANPAYTMERFIVWTVNMTVWSLTLQCFALLEQDGPCHIDVPVIVYKPPDNVSISLVNHTGAMLEDRRYTLQCSVEGVAPVENLTVTFYRGQKALGRPQSCSSRSKEPVTEIFALNFTTSSEDDGAEFWCEAELDLGPEGPQHPPVVKSQHITAAVHFGPQLGCPTKLQVREGEILNCEVRGNPQPRVTWFRDGQVVALPTSSSRQHAGKYTVLAIGPVERKNFTVEVEVLGGGGTANSCNGYFLLAVLMIQMINWL